MRYQTTKPSGAHRTGTSSPPRGSHLGLLLGGAPERGLGRGGGLRGRGRLRGGRRRRGGAVAPESAVPRAAALALIQGGSGAAAQGAAQAAAAAGGWAQRHMQGQLSYGKVSMPVVGAVRRARWRSRVGRPTAARALLVLRRLGRWLLLLYGRACSPHTPTRCLQPEH